MRETETKNGGFKMKKVYFDGETDKYGAYVQGASVTVSERLKELADTIAAATIARRYAATDWEREKINEIIERASAEKYRILGI